MLDSRCPSLETGEACEDPGHAPAARRPYTATQQRREPRTAHETRTAFAVQARDMRSLPCGSGGDSRVSGVTTPQKKMQACATGELRAEFAGSVWSRALSPKCTSPNRREDMRARLHDSPCRSPLAERRLPCVSAGSRGEKQGAQGSQVRRLVGMQNLGNTCFINTCVQCLSNLDPFGDFFLANQHIFQLNKHSSMKGTLALSFGELLHKVCHGTAFSSVAAATLRDQVGKFAPQFTGVRQHDCQELLRFLLDGLHEDLRCQAPVDTLMNVYGFQPEYEHAAAAQGAMLQRYEGNFSHVMRAFSGQLVSIVRCSTCGHSSHTFDPFLDLSLPIPEKYHVKENAAGGGAAGVGAQIVDLLECLESFCASELLEGDNMYMCETCGCKRKASKQLRLVRNRLWMYCTLLFTQAHSSPH